MFLKLFIFMQFHIFHFSFFLYKIYSYDLCKYFYKKQMVFIEELHESYMKILFINSASVFCIQRLISKKDVESTNMNNRQYATLYLLQLIIINCTTCLNFYNQICYF